MAEEDPRRFLPCRFQAKCNRPNCPFLHNEGPKSPARPHTARNVADPPPPTTASQIVLMNNINPPPTTTTLPSKATATGPSTAAVAATAAAEISSETPKQPLFKSHLLVTPVSSSSSSDGTRRTSINTKIKRSEDGARSKLAEFDILRQIGDGLVGKVYQVRMKETSAIYAMKVIPKKIVLEENMIHHMMSERNLMTAINHPFIIKVHYAFQNELQLFLISDYLRGGDLRFHLRNNGTFTPAQALFYSAELFLAVKYLHDIGIVHRDLKLANVLLDKDGHVGLTDFGMAKQLRGEEVHNDQALNTYVGTVSYMAPEIFAQQGHAFPADWWSFGVLVFEMFTGVRPFDGSDDADEIDEAVVRAQIETGEVVFPPELAGTAAVDLMRGLLDTNPKQRLKVAQIGAHPFFADIDWTALTTKQVPPPFTPYSDDDEGDEYTGNFPSSLTENSPPSAEQFMGDFSPGGGGGGGGAAKTRMFNMENFTYSSPSMMCGPPSRGSTCSSNSFNTNTNTNSNDNNDIGNPGSGGGGGSSSSSNTQPIDIGMAQNHHRAVGKPSPGDMTFSMSL